MKLTSRSDIHYTENAEDVPVKASDIRVNPDMLATTVHNHEISALQPSYGTLASRAYHTHGIAQADYSTATWSPKPVEINNILSDSHTNNNEITWLDNQGDPVLKIGLDTGEVSFSKDIDLVSKVFWEAIRSSTHRLVPKSEVATDLEHLMMERDKLKKALELERQEGRKMKELLGNVMLELKKTYKEDEKGADDHGRDDEV